MTSTIKNHLHHFTKDMETTKIETISYHNGNRWVNIRFKVHKDYKDYKNDKSREENMVAWGKARWERKFGNPFYKNSMF